MYERLFTVKCLLNPASLLSPQWALTEESACFRCQQRVRVRESVAQSRAAEAAVIRLCGAVRRCGAEMCCSLPVAALLCSPCLPLPSALSALSAVSAAHAPHCVLIYIGHGMIDDTCVISRLSMHKTLLHIVWALLLSKLIIRFFNINQTSEESCSLLLL